ncbi:TPA: hypothetical protein ACGSTL_001356 [Vibrio parahaemolyticus]|uniref:hypothetical protein n=1 Tax=Vibrio campbellii TaxID=680 RepID=UPI001F073AF7|nr:hypothetical protein [Vibrio campbellii]UMM06801.1 hypothetical protein MKR81_26435 [Vibrio campbellii]
MTVNTLTAYFKYELSKLGYDDIARADKIGWQLSYCQGDGIDFPHATLCEADAIILCDRIMTGKHKAAVKRALGKGLEVSVGGRYSAEFCDYNCDPELTSLEMAACEEFIKCIDDDLKSLEQRLKNEGYEYLDATPSVDEPEIAIERDLGRFKLVVSKTNCDWYDLFGSDDEEDMVGDYRVMQGIINGEDKFFDLKVELFDRCAEDFDSSLATTYLGACNLNTSETLMSVYGSEIRSMVTEAVDEARTELGMRNSARDERKAARAEARRQEFLAARAKAEREAKAEQARIKALAEKEAKKKAEAHELSMWSGLSLSGSPALIGFANI